MGITRESIAEKQKHFLLEVSYDGTGFYGWQIQPDQITVQKVLQDTLKRLYAGQDIKVQGSSRTDAGVHALGIGVSFSAPSKPVIPSEKLQIALNSLLPNTIRVRTISLVDETFNARFAAKGKAYTYVINTGEELPFSARYSWRQHNCHNIEEMKKAAMVLVGKHDFSSFVVFRSQVESAVRTIYDINFQQFGQYLCVTFTGDGFLYKMIRCLTGALVAVGNNKIDATDMKRLLDAKDRGVGEVTAPPHGLFLMKVFYGDYKWQDFKLDKLPFSY